MPKKNLFIILAATFFLLQCTVLDFIPGATTNPENPEIPEATYTPRSAIAVETAVPVATVATTPVVGTPVPAPSILGKNLFDYGAQLNWTKRDLSLGLTELKRMGFNWVKIQVRWCDFETAKTVADLTKLDQFMAAASSRGVKVLFSITCAPNWSRRDRGAGGSGPPDKMQDAVDFIGGMAGIYCKKGLAAIEVWNEHNLLTEWHGQPLSAAKYMELLRLAYAKIKRECPTAIVVSGAPTPTGLSDGVTAIDDVVFLEQLSQNGLKQSSDAVGAHPSGFCNAPDARNGTANVCGKNPDGTAKFGNHRSFFFRDTLEAYRAVMVKNGDSSKQIWPTEFGWGVDPNPKPGYEYEKFITLNQQSQWLVSAYQLMKSYGYIGVATLWNLDYLDMTEETGAFHVVGRPAYDALMKMAK